MGQGDHLRARRGAVWDHAVDLGDRTVIRFVPGRGLERTGYAGFTDGAEEVEVVVHRERVYRPPLVVARAFSRMAETAYAAMFSSPEQFAVWCKSGSLPPAPPGATATARSRSAPRGKARPARKSARRGKARPARKPVRRGKARPARKAAPRKARPVRKAPAKGRARRAGKAAKAGRKARRR
jgi:hypothetical protein